MPPFGGRDFKSPVDETHASPGWDSLFQGSGKKSSYMADSVGSLSLAESTQYTSWGSLFQIDESHAPRVSLSQSKGVDVPQRVSFSDSKNVDKPRVALSRNKDVDKPRVSFSASEDMEVPHRFKEADGDAIRLSRKSMLKASRRRTSQFCVMVDEGDATGSAAAATQMTLYEEAMHCLGMSFFSYMYSFQRDQSKLGFTKFSFDTFALESDTMTDYEIIQQEPLKLMPRSSYSVDDGTINDELIDALGGITMPQLYIREMQSLSEYGFPRKAKDLLMKLKSKAMVAFRVSRMMGESSLKLDEDDDDKYQGAPEISDNIIKAMDGMSKHGLKFTDPDKSKHVGRLESEMGLHHVQCVFDQIFYKAVKEKNPLYVKLKELYERPRAREGRADAHDITIEDQELIQEYMKDMHKESSIIRLLTSTSLGHEILVWIYDRSKDECVYLIFVNPVRKRITVIFRGTVTLQDIMKNTKFNVFELKNPIPEDYEGKTRMVELNKGYSEYLFEKRRDNGRTKYDEISDRVIEFAEYLWGDDPEFELCVSGHSLGGALATLYAFKASADPRFVKVDNPKPVRVFTYGGAIPGRITFAKAFQHQEVRGRLMHLRVVMRHDIVPCLHPMNQFDYAHTGYTMTVETKKFGHGEDEDGNRKESNKPTPPKYKYIHDKMWWKSKSANVRTNFLVNFPWRKPKFVIKAHDPGLYLKALIEAKADGQNAISVMRSSRVGSKRKGGRGDGSLPVDHHNWTLDEHYVQRKISLSKSSSHLFTSQTAMEPSAQELVAAMQEAVKANPSLKSKFNACVEFQLTGSDSFRLDVSKSPKDKPDLTVIASLDVFHKLLNKKLTPQQAFMQGKLETKGKMDLAMKLKLILNATRKVLQKNHSKLQRLASGGSWLEMEDEIMHA